MGFYQGAKRYECVWQVVFGALKLDLDIFERSCSFCLQVEKRGNASKGWEGSVTVKDECTEQYIICRSRISLDNGMHDFIRQSGCLLGVHLGTISYK